MDAASRQRATGLSAAEVARELGTSVPRVVRAAKRLGFDNRPAGGHLTLSAKQVQRLRWALGRNRRVEGLSTTETAALAALARSPFGLSSARAIARVAGLSPTAASYAVGGLVAKGLVVHEENVAIAGRTRRVRLYHANRRDPRYKAIATALAEVEPPRREPEGRVPFALERLFWNTAPEQLEVSHGGGYIARRLLRTLDPAGLAWGARNLDGGHWRTAARARGLDGGVRALAENLARASEA